MYLRFLIVALIGVLLWACQDAASNSTAIDCESGERGVLDGHTLCVFADPLLGSDFACPQSAPYESRHHDFVVCSDDQSPPTRFEERWCAGEATEEVPSGCAVSVEDARDNTDMPLSADAGPDDVEAGGAQPDFGSWPDASDGGDPFMSTAGNVRVTCSPDGFEALLLHTFTVDPACDLDVDNPDRVRLTLFRAGLPVFPIPEGADVVLGSDVDYEGEWCPGGGPCVAVTAGVVVFDELDMSVAVHVAASAGTLDVELANGTRLRQRFSAYLCPQDPATCAGSDAPSE